MKHFSAKDAAAIIFNNLVIVQPVKRSYLKALSDGYLQEVKRIASKQISIRQGGFKHKSRIVTQFIVFFNFRCQGEKQKTR